MINSMLSRRYAIAPASRRNMHTDRNEIDFDEEWYLLTYPDVATSVRVGEIASGLQHYLSHGRDEGRKPHTERSPFDGLADLLGPGPIREVRLDLTTRCDLRCVYCAVSQPWYDGADMGTEVLQKAVPAILQIAAHNQLEYFSVAGHGETTFMPGWAEV